MRHLPLAAVAFPLLLSVACSDRTIDSEPADYTADVERICADYCQMDLACREPAWFESYEECEHVCLHMAYIYNDTECGEATRDRYECPGSQPTCELYNDTLNVHADDYTCKATKDRWAEISQSCGQSSEDPFPYGAP